MKFDEEEGACVTCMHKSEMVFWAAALLVIAVLASAPLFPADTMVYGADTPFHLGRIESIKEGLLAGQFPVRVYPAQLRGYGMPTGIFYPDIFLYIPAFLRLTGMSLLVSWKTFLVLINLLTAFVAWWAFSTYTGSRRTGAVGALFYTVFIFRLGFMHILTAVAEILAMAFLPAALIAIWVTIRRDASYWPAAAFFSSCVLLSHILSSIFLVAATVLVILMSFRRFRIPDVRWAAGKAAGSIFLLTLWFYAPFLYFYTHMDFMMKSVTQQEVWYQLIYPWRDLDFYIGSSFFLVLAGLAVFMLLHRKLPGARTFWILLVGASMIIWLVSHPAPWHMLGTRAGFLQTPFRLMEFPAIFLSLAAAIGIGAVGLETWRRRCLVILCAAACLGANFLWMYGYTYTIPLHARQRCAVLHIAQNPAEKYFSQEDGYAVTVDYMDQKTHASIIANAVEGKDPFQEKYRDRAIHPGDRIQHASRTGNTMEIRYQAGAAQWIQLPLFWYMGYAAQEIGNREKVPLRRDEQGQVSVYLPPLSGSVRIWYDGLPWFHLTDLISWFSWFGFFYISYRSAGKKKHISHLLKKGMRRES